MNENIITWNVTNWVTVILMAAIGYFLLGLFLKWKQQRSGAASTPSTTPNPAPSAVMSEP